MKQARRLVGTMAVFAAMATILSGCLFSDNSTQGSAGNDFDFGDCTPVIVAVSPEKVNMFTELATLFEASPEAEKLESESGKCARIQAVDVSSGEAARLLNSGWPTDQTTKPRPVVWSPASSSWVADVAATSGEALVAKPVSFTYTPVVFAMPEKMASTMGYPNEPISINDLHDLCLAPEGWGTYGGSAALWGDFKLGKTNPNTSTTGRNMLLMQAYANAGKTEGLTVEDVEAASSFSQEFESCVIHYGDTTGNILNRVYDRGLEGKPLDYVSAIAVEETSVINYNIGNPTSRVVAEGEVLTPPAEKLVAIYPEGGSLISDNPIVTLGGPNADWVSEEQKTAGDAFISFVQTDTAQSVLDDFGFRPLDRDAKIEGLFTAENKVNPAMPTTLLEPPSVSVTTAATQQWEQIRKPSSVLVLIDVSGSMSTGTGVNMDGRDMSRMDLAVYSAQQTLGHFRPTDELGVWAFTTGVESAIGPNVVEVRPLGPLASGRERLSEELGRLTPLNDTPLFDSVATAYEYMLERAEAGRINAIIVLSDGEDTASFIKTDELKRLLQNNSEGTVDAPVRVFPIIYGDAAPADVLQEIAEASGGQVFNASDPRRLAQVFQSVVNNF